MTENQQFALFILLLWAGYVGVLLWIRRQWKKDARQADQPKDVEARG